MTPLPKASAPIVSSPTAKLNPDQLAKRISGLKNDLNETPNSKHKYKILMRELKDFEKQSFKQVVRHVFNRLLSVPQKIHYRVLLDLADLAKRESKFREAKFLFKLVIYLQPYAYQSWLEFAKMEEECGNQKRARLILKVGLRFLPLND